MRKEERGGKITKIKEVTKEKVKKIYKTVQREFVYGGHLQSLGALSIAVFSSLILSIKANWHVLLASYLVFYPSYLYNRFKEIKIDKETNPERTSHLESYLNHMPFIFFGVISSAILTLIFFSNLGGLLFGFCLIVFGVLYTSVFKKLTKIIPLFKNFYVSLFFASMVFFLPVYEGIEIKESLLLKAGILAFIVYIKSLMIQFFLDVKDVKTDTREGLRSLPILLGEDRVFFFLKIMSIIGGFLGGLLLSSIGFLGGGLFFFIGTVIFDFYCFRKAKKGNYSAYILKSGEFLLWPILALIGEFLI